MNNQLASIVGRMRRAGSPVSNLVNSKRSKVTHSGMIEIDGSQGEGGGQILRNTATYAAILGHPKVRIFNIRANRSKPGLKSQHLTALILLSQACNGTLEGGSVGAEDVTLEAAVSSNSGDETGAKSELVGDTKTAGSIVLLLQAVIPFALCGANREIKWKLRGGTNASMAPQYDYWEHIFLPSLHNMGLSEEFIEATVIRRGYFPKGGGEVVVSTRPHSKPLPPILLTERGDLKLININSFYGGKCPKHVAHKMARAAETHIRLQYPSVPIQTKISYHEYTVGSGAGILLCAVTTTGCRLGCSALSSPKQSPKNIGMQCAMEICNTLKDGGCVDEYLQDQLIIYMALSSGMSEILTGSLTLHTQSAIAIAEQLCNVTFHVQNLENSTNLGPDSQGRIPGKHLIRCEGMGFQKTTNC